MPTDTNKLDLQQQAIFVLNALVDGDLTTGNITGAADGAALSAIILAKTTDDEGKRQSYRRRSLDLDALVAGGDFLPASVVGPATGMGSLITHLATFDANITGVHNFTGSFYLQ